MASVHEYKRFENSLVQKVKNAAKTIVKSIAGVFKGIGNFLTRRYTVVFVPHSEKKVYNLHVTVLSICCFLLVAAGILGAIFWYGVSYNSARNTLIRKDGNLNNLMGNLDNIKEELTLLLPEARAFENTLTDLFSELGVNYFDNNPKSSTNKGDLGSFFDFEEIPDGVSPEVDNLKRLKVYISSIIKPLQELSAMLGSHNILLAEIPSIWPIKGGIGHVSMLFGQNENPFTGQYYIHKGIDLSTYRAGDPVVVTANGQVATIDYADDFGNYIIVRHKHGYYTRYAHLLSTRVKIGQLVQQGEVIGYIGNTGLSTGPHLHYEVHVGSDVVDPHRFINIRSSVARQGR